MGKQTKYYDCYRVDIQSIKYTNSNIMGKVQIRNRFVPANDE